MVLCARCTKSGATGSRFVMDAPSTQGDRIADWRFQILEKPGEKPARLKARRPLQGLRPQRPGKGKPRRPAGLARSLRSGLGGGCYERRRNPARLKARRPLQGLRPQRPGKGKPRRPAGLARSLRSGLEVGPSTSLLSLWHSGQVATKDKKPARLKARRPLQGLRPQRPGKGKPRRPAGLARSLRSGLGGGCYERRRNPARLKARRPLQRQRPQRPGKGKPRRPAGLARSLRSGLEVGPSTSLLSLWHSGQVATKDKKPARLKARRPLQLQRPPPA